MSKRPDRPIIYDLVKIDHQRVVTTSLIVAERFEKRHADVMRDVRAMIGGPAGSSKMRSETEEEQEFGGAILRRQTEEQSRRKTRKKGLDPQQQALLLDLRREFAKGVQETTYFDERGKEQPMFLLDKEASRKLTMGFTGERAEIWQFLFVRAFSEMEKELRRLRENHADPGWQEQRTLGKIARRSLTDVIADYDGYGIAEGEKSSGMFYTSVTKAIQHALFKPDDGVFKELRPRLTKLQLNDLATVERAVARRLDTAMLQGKPRKGDGGCYDEIKATIERLVEEIGVSTVPPLEVVPALPGMQEAA